MPSFKPSLLPIVSKHGSKRPFTSMHGSEALDCPDITRKRCVQSGSKAHKPEAEGIEGMKHHTCWGTDRKLPPGYYF